MNQISFGDLKASELPGRVNLCPDDPRFAQRVNRALSWLFNCGSFQGTIKHVRICVYDRCFVTPPFVANVEGLRACQHALRIENDWYRMLPGFNPHHWDSVELYFEFMDYIPSIQALCSPVILRSFVSSSTDKGKTIKFLGYDNNKQWVRTKQNGLIRDGEVVTLDSPFADTITTWTSITAVSLPIRDGAVTVFSYPPGDDSVLTPFGVYQHWETNPTYQRYRIHGQDQLQQPFCLSKGIVEAEVKLCHIPVSADDDILPISNQVALEMAVEGVKALDDGELARADALLFGDARNQRIGAIPLLNQQIRTETGDRFAAHIRFDGPCGFRTIMRGMI